MYEDVEKLHEKYIVMMNDAETIEEKIKIMLCINKLQALLRDRVVFMEGGNDEIHHANENKDLLS